MYRVVYFSDNFWMYTDQSRERQCILWLTVEITLEIFLRNTILHSVSFWV